MPCPPRVLVIAANPFSDINNNGKTLKSIFSVFPKDSLCMFYTRPQDNVIGDGVYASSYYAVAEMDIIRSILHQSRSCGGVQVFDGEKDKAIANNKTYRWFLNGRLKDVGWLRSLLWRTRRWDTQDFKDWYLACRPDIVFALLGGASPLFTISKEVASKLNIPLALYFTDDYLLHSPQKSLFDKIRYRKNLKAFKDIVEFSSIRFCIGELMCEKYSDFFKKPFYPIMNVVDIKPFNPYQTNNVKPRCSYFGSLWLDRWKMLVRLASIIGDVADIYVYSSSELRPEMREALSQTGIRLCKPVLGDAYQSAIFNSDYLLHVESDSLEYRERTALSISTKLPEYLVSGKPIIGFGPKEIASMRLLNDNGIGIVISSEEDEMSCRERILSFIRNSSYQHELVIKAYEFAAKNYDKKKTSERVLKQLYNTVIEYKVSHF